MAKISGYPPKIPNFFGMCPWIYIFIHSENLYSASSTDLLGGTLCPTVAI